MAAVCSGALLLANSGMLDGKPATNHWSREREITRHFPKVLWDLNQIYFLQEGLATLAGVTAGIDMALNLIRADCGGACALQVAQELVVSQHRLGGQRQFGPTLKAQFTTQGTLGTLIEALFETAHRHWTPWPNFPIKLRAAYHAISNAAPKCLQSNFQNMSGLNLPMTACSAACQ